MMQDLKANMDINDAHKHKLKEIQDFETYRRLEPRRWQSLKDGKTLKKQ